FDLARRDWSPEVVAALEIDPGWLPRSWEGPQVTGTLTSAAAEATGLRPGTPVVAGGGDQSANAVGVGVVAPGSMALSLGTSGVVFAATAEPLARGAFVGLTLAHDRRHLTRAVLEGVAFGLRDGLDLMLAAGTPRPAQIRVSGGGTASPVWRQILADVLEAEIATVSTAEG